MIDRETALSLILQHEKIADSETVELSDSVGRVLTQPVLARRNQPPADMSAMDGYAVQKSDAISGARLRVIGEAAAGAPFSGQVGAGECVRIFTGSVIPDGADFVVIQEDTRRDGDWIEIAKAQTGAGHIRRAGIDFAEGQELIASGARLKPRHIAVCAAANHDILQVRRKPRVGLLSNGDELRPPGSVLEPGQIIASNDYALEALITAWGGEAVRLGITPDDPDAIRNCILKAEAMDVFVPIGGASVGDHDQMKPVFSSLGYQEVFSKVAIRPGKPTWMFRSEETTALGLPGNPASALVCAHLFLRPLVKTLLGLLQAEDWVQAKLTEAIPSNGQREAFSRAQLVRQRSGELCVQPAGNQDSSLLTPFIEADVLIRRAPGASALEAGDLVDCVLLD